jgi:plasmid stabilization system protein ParE
MVYLVNITTRAERDFVGLFDEIHAADSEAASKWHRGLKDAILSLEKLPNRCPVTRENPQLRHLLYGRKPHIYRVIFRVSESEGRVDILHIRHGARRGFKDADLGQDTPKKPVRPA